MTAANPHLRKPESKNVEAFVEIHDLTELLIEEGIIGKHGYEQYYRNVYQNMFNYAVRKCVPKRASWKTWLRLGFLRYKLYLMRQKVDSTEQAENSSKRTSRRL